MSEAGDSNIEPSSGGSGNKGGRSVLDVSAAVTLLLAVATAISYLNGRAYHDGYLSYLNLSSSMFPLQGSDAAVLSAVAWINAIVGYLNGLERWPLSDWLKLAGFSIVFIILVGTIVYFGKKSEEKELKKNNGPKKTSWLKTVAKSGLMFFSSIYVIFFLLLMFAMLLAFLISPFLEVGRDQAREDLKGKFKDSPVIFLKDPKGATDQEYKIIECSAVFCALYKDGDVVTVPIAKVEWAVSKPDKN
ncbi:hypothetical protein [Pseudomonas oryzihabitans]|uniref:hypothetical protein n=1 Tax=Pseudomonas oryzihabitans TaxID=47885 RepID=UPI000A694421|nr:hypothetical protein [Pseudomonas oryzihabitans]